MSGLNGHGNGEAKRGRGRPTKYDPVYPVQAMKLCLLGATDVQLADFLEVDEATIHRWKHEHPEFCESIKDGKARADAVVADSLYHRARGYSHPAVKIVADAKTGQSVQVEYTEHFPPDTAACIFWLKNRRRDCWRDKQDHEHEGGLTVTVRYANEDSVRMGELLRG